MSLAAVIMRGSLDGRPPDPSHPGTPDYQLLQEHLVRNFRFVIPMIPLLILGILAAAVPASAEDSVAAPSPSPRFVLGFKALADQIPDVAGTPLENEHYGANGDSLQQTSNGLLAWRKADN